MTAMMMMTLLTARTPLRPAVHRDMHRNRTQCLCLIQTWMYPGSSGMTLEISHRLEDLISGMTAQAPTVLQ
ncbi:hypothetical protein DPMN_014170 [Dreissena polymorpha]|uniref:Uncharacterized protein n=1 Tax=Dreissena polymorpha TaxID=45954 RepID=A0A9D4S2G4_DREPO|nr:hypothetical protein DPMN_014170 [Dreissena polymorpha]